MTSRGRRLSIVHTESSLGWGGQEIRIVAEAEGLKLRGHEMTIVCPPDAALFRAARARGLAAVPLPIGRLGWKNFHALRAWIADRPRIDVVNTHSPTDNALAALAAATLSRAPPLVRTRHVSTPGRRNPLSRWLYRTAARHIVTTGEAVRAMLAKEHGLAPEKITSVPTGIDLARFHPGDRTRARMELNLPADGFYVGVVAALRDWKGHADLLRALAQLRGRHSDLRLLVVGSGPERENLERLVAELDLGAAVVLAGERSDVPSWLNAMDLFALPSHAHEGMPQAVMQAMAAGVPVVATEIGAVGEAVAHGETGLLVPPRSVAALAQALERLIADAPARAAMGRAARARAEARFGVAAMLDKMEAVFYSVARKPA